MNMRQRLAAVVLASSVGLLSPLGLAATDQLAETFQHPPEEAKPWVFWYWMSANVTREGITRDLEAMAETGIGGAYLMSIGPADKEKTLIATQANPLSEAWWGHVIHAAKEAQRLGLRLAMNACDGWALAGGPWITPERSMQQVVMTTRLMEGGKPVSGKLARPLTRENYYQDIAVLAYPALEGADLSSLQLKPKVTSDIPGFDPHAWSEQSPKLVEVSQEGWLQYAFEKPFTCRSLVIAAGQREAYQLHRAEVQVSDDGTHFRSLGRLKPTQFHGFHDLKDGCTHALVPTTARFFRFVLDRSGTPPPSENHEGAKERNRDKLVVAPLELRSRPSIGHWEGKAGYLWRRSDWTSEAACPPELCVSQDHIVNLTDKLSPDGTLNWTPPPGRWVVQRIGHTSTGKRNAPAGTGSGLECDKFCPEAARDQFNGWFGEALHRVGPGLAGTTLARNHTDSWECGSQNWSRGFRAEFITRRGYDPVPWLPVMKGVPIASVEQSERFLYDVRRTIADLICDNFYAPLVKLGKEKGVRFSTECVAPMVTSDGLQHFKYADLPMGEFWMHAPNQDKPNDIQDAISAGRTYGKRIIGAEAFTSFGIKWTENPYYLKAMGDYNYAKGINHFVLHVWCHQAFDKAPGVTLNSTYGIPFGGIQPWHKPGKSWLDYLRRCSALLQQGLPVVDVCYFTGEELPSRSYLRHDLPVPLKAGYAYDCINRDALLTRATAQEGRLVLPDGLSYRLLVLPPTAFMTPALARKIGELAQAGVPVLATPPTRSISLENYPACDKEVRALVEASWRKVRMQTGTQTVLDELGVSPDVEFPGAEMALIQHAEEQYASPPLAWTHRLIGEDELYFISNQERRTREVEASFRVTGRLPELWDAETGMRRDAGLWRQEKGRTLVTLRLAPAASIFVVFRRASGESNPVARITPQTQTASPLAPLWLEAKRIWGSQNGTWQLIQQSGQTTEVSIKGLLEPRAVAGPWTVTLSSHSGSPVRIVLSELRSLSEHTASDVKYFSGTAGYETVFEGSVQDANKRYFLDLGSVANLAEVTVNGQKLGVLWKPPYLLEVSAAMKPGLNTLYVEVSNTWKNRLIGDSSLPSDQRTTWTWEEKMWFTPATPLEPSGLLGPVVIREAVSPPFPMVYPGHRSPAHPDDRGNGG